MHRTITTATVVATTAVLALTATPAQAAGGWQQATTPGDFGQLSAVSCPTAHQCWAVGGSVLHSTDGGAHWSEQHAGGSPGDDTYSGVSCPTTKVCWAIATSSTSFFSSLVAHTTNGGATWSVKKFHFHHDALDTISCPTTKTCVSSALHLLNGGHNGRGVILVTRNAGKSWHKEGAPETTKTVEGSNGVDCVTTKVCWAVGDGFVMATTNGKSWHLQHIPHAKDILESISCTNRKDCTAAGKLPPDSNPKPVILTTTNGGHHWRTRQAPSGRYFLAGVSCATAKACWAVGADTANPQTAYEVGTTDGGKHWSSQTESGEGLLSVSCGSTGQCAAVGSNGSQVALYR